MLLNVYLLKIGFSVSRLMGAGRHCSWSSSLLDLLMHNAQRQDAELADLSGRLLRPSTSSGLVMASPVSRLVAVSSLAASRLAMSIQAELVLLRRIWNSRGHYW